MKIIKYFNWILVGLFFINIVNAVISDENNKEYESLMTINERDSIKLPGLKRPFCNAFTGCGKKRNSINSSYDTNKNDVNDSTINIPLKLYQILMNNLNLKIQKVAKHKNYRDSINNYDDDYFFSNHKQLMRKPYNL